MTTPLTPRANLDLIGTNEAAEILGITRGALNRRCELGQVEPFAEIGKRGTRVFLRSEIEDMAAPCPADAIRAAGAEAAAAALKIARDSMPEDCHADEFTFSVVVMVTEREPAAGCERGEYGAVAYAGNDPTTGLKIKQVATTDVEVMRGQMAQPIYAAGKAIEQVACLLANEPMF